MSKLNQIVAVERDVKSQAEAGLAATKKNLQKTQLLSGLSRVYTPVDDDDRESLPDESTRVQLTVQQILDEFVTDRSRLLDLTATKDFGNVKAKGTVTLNGKTLLADVPVPFLLFLEKELEELSRLLKTVPTLDASEEWELDKNTGQYKTKPEEKIRTKKVPRNHVIAEATPQHPAQVQVYTEDVKAGTWRNIKFSGAVPATQVAEWQDKVKELLVAIKYAREEANLTQVDDLKVANKFFDYIFKK